MYYAVLFARTLVHTLCCVSNSQNRNKKKKIGIIENNLRYKLVHWTHQDNRNTFHSLCHRDHPNSLQDRV